MTGKKYKDPEIGVFGSEEGWLKDLIKDKGFKATYDSIDWNSPEIKFLINQELQKLKGM